MEDNRLLKEFPATTYEVWHEAAEASLQGAAFEKRLITRTYEEIDVQPLYRQEDIADIAHTNTLPGFPPYVRSTSSAGYRAAPWLICQELPYGSPAALNEALRYDIERGQNAINLLLDRATRWGKDASEAPAGEVGMGGVSVSTLHDMATMLQGISLEQTPVFIQAGAVALPIAALFLAAAQQSGAPIEGLCGCIGADPLGTLATEGTLPLPLADAYRSAAQLIAWAQQNAPGLRTLLVQGHPYHDAGGNATQELAFAIATGLEYLREMQQQGLSIDTTATALVFSFSVGSNFFMEIAKLRAARLLWATIVGAAGGSEEAQKMVIHARTSAWNKTVYDPYVNMLRTTAEAFAGVMGGAGSLHVSPFDEPVQPPDEFSRRVARNTHIILQQESNLANVVDPAGGSWYVEHLTDSVARKAWALFQEVEKQGGIRAALEAGFPQAQVAQTAGRRAQNIAQRRDVVVGTNLYPNLKEKPLENHQSDAAALSNERAAQVQQFRAATDAELHAAALELLAQATGEEQVTAPVVEAGIAAALDGATIGDLFKTMYPAGEPAPTVQAVRIHRGAELYEALRKASEQYATQHGTPPTVFLANMGPIPQHKPRADFATGFFEVGGFQVLSNSGFASAEEAAQAAIESQAPIVVICSTDPTYPELVPPLTTRIKQERPGTLVVLAGYPADQVEAHKAAGVDEFIHLRANCYETLASFQKKIGVAL